jgi:hypothetical protein
MNSFSNSKFEPVLVKLKKKSKPCGAHRQPPGPNHVSTASGLHRPPSDSGCHHFAVPMASLSLFPRPLIPAATPSLSTASGGYKGSHPHRGAPFSSSFTTSLFRPLPYPPLLSCHRPPLQPFSDHLNHTTSTVPPSTTTPRHELLTTTLGCPPPVVPLWTPAAKDLCDVSPRRSSSGLIFTILSATQTPDSFPTQQPAPNNCRSTPHSRSSPLDARHCR